MSNYLYIITIVQALIIFIVLLSAWFLGVVKTFTLTSGILPFLPAFVRYIVAGVLAVISFLVPLVSCPIGFIDLILRFVAFVKRKVKDYENESNENIPLWYRVLTNENTGLVLAYIVIPLHVLLLRISLWELSDMKISFSVIDMFYVYIPPTIIRFVLKPKGLDSISEIFACIVLSFSCSFGLYYVFENIIYFPTIFDEIFVCLVLSYKSKRKDNSRLATCSMWLFLIILAIMRRVIRRGEPLLGALMSTVSAFFIISPFLLYLFLKEHNAGREPEPPSDTTQDTYRPPVDTAAELADIGLAHIGRKTNTPNKYLSMEQSAERLNIERPFLRLLADRYRDELQRKILARHFMLCKETTLFIIFSIVLKGNKALHDSVRSRLNERLSLGLAPEILKKRNGCWHRISRKFHDEYKQTKDIGHALNFSFWSSLAVDNPGWITFESISDMLDNDNLYNVFRYSYRAVERAYKDLLKQL